MGWAWALSVCTNDELYTIYESQSTGFVPKKGIDPGSEIVKKCSRAEKKKLLLSILPTDQKMPLNRSIGEENAS